MRKPHQPGALDIVDRPWSLAVRLAIIFLGSCIAWAAVVFLMIVIVRGVFGHG